MLISVNSEIARIIERQRVIARRDHSHLGQTLYRLAERGELRVVLPGVFAPPDTCADLDTRAAAACRYDRSAVITGDAAAALSFWPELEVETIVVAGGQHRVTRPGFEFVRRTIPPAFVRARQGVRLTAPGLTALDQVDRHGGAGIARALRSQRVSLDEMRAALDATPCRVGNDDGRAVLLDSRNEPWSELERLAHRLLRDAGIDGWSANVWVETAAGDYIVDIAFHHSPLCLELDGRKYHGPPKFDEDRLRANELLLAGKIVLRFTWTMLRDHPQLVITTVRRALAQYGVSIPSGHAHR